MLDLTGQTVLLTGACQGHRRCHSAHSWGAGAHLVAHYHKDRAGVEASTASIAPHRRYLLQADLAGSASADDLWRNAVAWRGRIDVLVNKAAVFLIDGGIEDDEAAWDSVWETTGACAMHDVHSVRYK